MAELEIIGFDLSNWVRAARLACEENERLGLEFWPEGPPVR